MDGEALVICLLLVVISVLLVRLWYFISAIKSKKQYEDMIEFMARERELIKADRIRINSDLKSAQSSNGYYNVENIKLENALNRMYKDFDYLAQKYVNFRIDLLKSARPNIKESPSAMYKLQDLVNKKKLNRIDRMAFINEVESVLDGLFNESL